MEQLQSSIAFFDFDGTLTTKDSLADFIQFSVGSRKYWLGLTVLAPFLVAYKLRLISNHTAKERLISHFFKGWDYDSFQELADNYSIEHLDRIIRPEAIKKLNWHKSQGHRVVVASASMNAWLSKWCEMRSVDLIATELEVQSGKLTGRFATKNCNGDEKVNRIRQQYDLDSYGTVYAYGDSSGDLPMLNIADKTFFRCFE